MDEKFIEIFADYSFADLEALHKRTVFYMSIYKEEIDRERAGAKTEKDFSDFEAARVLINLELARRHRALINKLMTALDEGDESV